jgi:RNA recognition motif. (a.k.a. RRM, RBD, or RNP domain)
MSRFHLIETSFFLILILLLLMIFNRTMQSSYPPSPQISAQGIPIPYVPGMPLPRSVSDRSASFDESMLPQSADSVGFSAVQAGGIGAGTLFAHQQPWGYGAPHDMYGASSPLQARPTVPYPGQLGGPPRHHHPSHMPPYGGQYFPAASPGPPIQTTASNKGPDGANLFIFHIPNHFTNVDMYQLFYPYGNLLSVRIMVEKDSGRSRGFGFVSYDSPDAAALAIKELNGYAVSIEP